VESFCSIDDHLPDGFYDAGRDMPFMSLEEYERSLGLYAREVILLDRLVPIPIHMGHLHSFSMLYVLTFFCFS
jgi:hypothetical protein